MKRSPSDWVKTFPRFDDVMLSLAATRKQPAGMIREYREVMALARAFNDEVVRPYALKLDREVSRDPTFLPFEFVAEANRWGLYSLWIPRIFGGRGYSLPSICLFLEELASACTAMANLVGVHYLGIATLFSSWNAEAASRICREVVEGERKDRPCLVSLALTEPDAGTDIEEVELMDKGSITCRATQVDGGYSVTGNKVFISNGHLSTWHMLFAFEDTGKPSSSLALLAVKTGWEGFSFGRMEKKMGQKGCPASELIFKDCFVSSEHVLLDPRQVRALKRSSMDTTMQVIDYIFSVSRAGVCAFGAGVARGAFETALAYAESTRVGGVRLVDQGWVQSLLAEMYTNVTLSRLAYMEANYANGLYGMYRLLQFKPLYYLMKWSPRWLMQRAVAPLFSKRLATWFLRKAHFNLQRDAEISRTSGWASLAKCVGTDAGVKNGQLALSLMGRTGVRHDGGAEKHLRDAKLMQIYEGTNQLNRQNLFKCLIGDGGGSTGRSFEDEEVAWSVN